MSDSLRPHGLYSPWNSPGQNTGVGGLSLLQGLFPTQGSDPGLLHCRQIFYQLSHQGSPHMKRGNGLKALSTVSQHRGYDRCQFLLKGFASQPSALSSTPSCPCWLRTKLWRGQHPPECLPSGEEDSPLRLLTSLFGVNCPGSSLLAQGHGLNMPERHVSRKFRSANQQAPSLSQQISDQIIVP